MSTREHPVRAAVRETLERRIPHDDGTPRATFPGGMRTPFYDAVRHTTDLEVFDWGIHLGPISRAVSLVVPVWEATYDELGVIRPVVFGHRRHISTLRFFLQREESQWVLFRTRDIEAVMGALEGAGARVSRDIERVYRLDPVRPRPAH